MCKHLLHLSCNGGDEGGGAGRGYEGEGVAGGASRICRRVEGQTHRDAVGGERNGLL